MNFKILLVFFALLSSHAFARNKGHLVAKKLEKANNGFIGESGIMKLVLIDAYGTKIVREMEGKTLEVVGDGDKSLSIFLNPKDVKGTKMLTWSHKLKDNDQWLYLPSLRRVKRISSKNKSASFMGSEFTYEDLGSQEIEKYSHRLINENKKQWVLERVPKDHSGYSKQISWISKKINNPTKVEYYDRKNELLKVAKFSKFKRYKVAGKTLYRPGKIHMKNVQTKKESIFSWANRKVGKKFPANEFKKAALK